MQNLGTSVVLMNRNYAAFRLFLADHRLSLYLCGRSRITYGAACTTEIRDTEHQNKQDYLKPGAMVNKSRWRMYVERLD